jgi:hypothetical protein
MKTAIEILLENRVIDELSVNYEDYEFVSDDPKKLLPSIEQYANQFKLEWISVNDNLVKPIDHQRYEVFGMRRKKRSKKEIGPWIDFAYALDGGFINVIDSIDYQITHWRELPTPPKT